jgi:uncharacterized delta-60 repeat protein/uncharacterized repeat protein (TIGR01451 family)
VWLSIAATSAWAQPANDSFATAEVIANPSGFAVGTTIAATLEAGEPSILGNAGGQSIWYAWTAPADQTITFNTVGSTFDTLLAAYTGTNVEALVLMQANDNTPGGHQSSITFDAVAGTTYYVAVDGYNAGSGAAQGAVKLNWGPGSGKPLLAGDFRFTSSYYLYSQSEDAPPVAANMLASPARLTVTRDGGAAGRVLVNYTVTAGLYTNITAIYIGGTNIMMTNSADNSFTNIVVTNINAFATNQEYGYGTYHDIVITSTTNWAETNFNGQVAGPSITISNDVGTNVLEMLFPCADQPPQITVITDTNATPAINVTIVTNIFCTNFFVTNIIASSLDGPYTGTLVFDDWQMSQDIFVPAALPTRTFFGNPSEHPPMVINAYFVGTIDSVALDPLESTLIGPPTAGSPWATTAVAFLNNFAYAFSERVNENDPHFFLTGRMATNVFNFERATLQVQRNAWDNSFQATIYVRRTSLDYSGSASVNYRLMHRKCCPAIADNANNLFANFVDEIPLQAGSEYAFPPGAPQYGVNPDFESVTGTLSWGANDAELKPITFYVTNYNEVQFNKDVQVELFFPGDGPAATSAALGYTHFANVTILFNDIDTNLVRNATFPNTQPAGAVDRFFNMDDYDNTTPPYNQNPGANGTVYAVAAQPDGKTLLAGDFTAYNGAKSFRIARATSNGQRDTSFDPKDGADRFITSMVLNSDQSIIIAGAFNSVNRVARPKIARLKSDGSLDTTFFPGLGANDTIWALARLNNGNLLVAGEFTAFNGLPRHYIARLNDSGALDEAFDPGEGPDGPIYAMTVQADGRVIIGGDFLHVNGVPRSHIARLNANGTLDASFDPGFGADATLYTIRLQPDGKILVGGSFTSMGSRSRNGVARLNANGTLDESFDPGVGADNTVFNVNVQQDGKILVAGIFRSFNQTRRAGIARLFSWGPIDTTFMDTAYNQFAGLVNRYWNPDAEPRAFIFTTAILPDNGIIIGGGFNRVGGGFSRTDVRVRNNFAKLIGGQTPGPGNIELVRPELSVNQYNPNNTRLFVPLTRTNGMLGLAAATVSVDSQPPGPGSAVDGVDFSFDPAYSLPFWDVSWPETWHQGDGTYGNNQGFSLTVEPGSTWSNRFNDCWIDLVNNPNMGGDRQFSVKLSDPYNQDIFFLGGENIPLGLALGRSSSTVNIIDDSRLPGVLGFSSAQYLTSEKTNALITIIRTNGAAGAISIKYSTANGTATNGIHYTAVSGQHTFLQDQTNWSFVVPIRDDNARQGDHTVLLRLSDPGGGAGLGLTNAVLTIVDNDIVGGYAQFSAPSFGTNEDAVVALVSVDRRGSGSGTLSAVFAANNGSAVNGFNFAAVTNTLTWVDGDVDPKIIPLRVFTDGISETTPLTVNLRLSDAAVNGVTNSQSLGNPITATLYLTNSDFAGQLGFSTTGYTINENGGPAIVTIIRRGGSTGAQTVNFATLPGTAVANVDYLPTNGTIYFGPGELSKSIQIPILNNEYQDVSRFITLALSGAAPPSALGTPTTAVVNIRDDESFNEPPGGLDSTIDPVGGFNGDVFALALQSDGKIVAGGNFTTVDSLGRQRLARLNADGTLDPSFLTTSTNQGANGTVQTILVQSDRRILIGGAFTAVNSDSRFFLARLNVNGTTDSTFDPGTGPDNSVFALGETFLGSQRKVLVGGSFATYNTFQRPYLVQLNADGSLDPDFNLGQGLNGPVYAIAVQPDGKIVIGGAFTSVNGVGRSRIARLNANGSLDLSFDPGAGANDVVRALAVQLDGRILVGGSFTSFASAPLNRIARLNPGGTIDTSFNPGTGANDEVSSIAIQPDTRIVLAGRFTLYNGVTRGRITRLNIDGSADTMINFGSGANSFVSAALVQTNDMIVFAGSFTEYNGVPRNRWARIYSGTVSGQGTLEFDAPVYQVNEDATNIIVGVRRLGGTSGSVSVNYRTVDGTAKAGINYQTMQGTLQFPSGEVVQRIVLPVLRDYAIAPDLSIGLELSNPQPAGGPALGNSANATVLVRNVDSAVSFTSSTFVVPENALNGFAILTLRRVGSTNGTASVDVYTTTNGTALATTNYIPVTNTVSFAAGQVSNFFTVPVIYDTRAQGNTTVILQLTNAINSLLVNPAASTLTILDVDRLPGTFTFSETNYLADEGAGFAAVTVLRTNGYSGTVGVSYSTRDGSAIAGLKYAPTNGVLSFSDGESSKVIRVPIIENSTVEGNQDLLVVLANATGGASIFRTNAAPVLILDNDIGVAFSSPVYIGTETDGSVTLTVNRVGTNSTTSVSYGTTNGTAIAGTNYASTSGTLTFNRGETVKTFNIPVLHDKRVTGPVSFNVNLFSATPQTQIYANNPTTVTLNDAEPGLFFTNANFFTYKSATNVLITVVRTNANTGLVSVNYATGDDSALAGVDYVPVSGTLTFSNGIAERSFVVPIINNNLVQDDRSFFVRIQNPSAPGQLLSPSVATVTITNDVAGLSYSSSAYTVNENGAFANVTVVRSGYTNNTVSVSYATTGGTAIPNVNYIPVSGTFTFTNGETAKSFSVPIRNNSIVEGDKTVVLELRNIVGRGIAVLPSSAVLTIVETDGSLIVPAGTALVSESGPVNGVIDPNEEVSLLFAFRNASGTNTGNLLATLLTTNGIATPSAPQSYGKLTVHGPSAFRQFSFKAAATNGQRISATFLLTDGNAPSNIAVFPFTVGRSSFTFSNTAPIVINQSGAATPYPSTIAVSGVGDIVSSASVTLTNFYHSWPRDVSMLLVAPTGPKSYLMSKAGGTMSANRVTLTFDDAAAAGLPNGQLTSGTYKPTSFATVTPPFPTPAPPVTAGSPYATNMAVFNGANPNGDWSLFVLDDTGFNSGLVSNGWLLKLSTAAPVAANADVGLASFASPSPVILNSNVTLTVTVTNFGPAVASTIAVTDQLPPGAALVSSAASTGSTTTNGNGRLTWNINSLNVGGYATLTLVVRPQVAVAMTNLVTVTTASSDLNPEDDSSVLVIPVLPPTADLVLGMVGQPNPATAGSLISYVISVTNIGPATATALSIVDTLPPGVTFVSAAPAGFTLSDRTLTFTNLGSLGAGSQLTASISVRADVGGTLTNTATINSLVTDPLKLNNTASVKTEVGAVTLTITTSGGNITLAWSASADYVLQSAESLVEPVTWTTVTEPEPIIVNGQKVVTIPIGPGTQFFRLQGQTQ